LTDLTSLLAQDLADARIACARNVALAPFTTFKIGGPAAVLAFPKDTRQVAACVRLANAQSVPYLPLGWGSNVLVADDGYPHLVIATRDLDWVRVEGALVRCGGGLGVPDLANIVAEHGLTGMEKICDVPGSVGGGVYMNAGCDGVTLGDLLTEVTWVGPDGDVATRPRAEIHMAYRESEFTGTSRIVTEVVLRLVSGADRSAIAGQMEGVRCERAAKFPLPYPNCGSVFRRVDPAVAEPWVKTDGKGAHSAGYYIERVGLKGQCIGNAQISEVHANFIVNLGGATAADVRALINLATDAVRERFGIELHREVNLIDADGRH
jgi:UDP-N-acetylmuramate dehydrogenase